MTGRVFQSWSRLRLGLPQATWMASATPCGTSSAFGVIWRHPVQRRSVCVFLCVGPRMRSWGGVLWPFFWASFLSFCRWHHSLSTGCCTLSPSVHPLVSRPWCAKHDSWWCWRDGAVLRLQLRGWCAQPRLWPVPYMDLGGAGVLWDCR